MTLHFNKPYLDLDDKPVKVNDGKDINLGWFLAQVMSQDIGPSGKDAFKIDSAMRIAKALHGGKPLEVTDSEAELINDAILGSSAIISLKHQLLAVVKGAKLAGEVKTR